MTIRLLLTVEGLTELRFAEMMLTPHLAWRGVCVVKPRLASLGRKKHKVHRGGMSRYEPIRKDIVNWLKQERASDVRFSTMFDLYGLPDDFPSWSEAAKAGSPYRRVELLETAFAADIGDPRFIPYIQLYEFETLLLSDVSVLAEELLGRNRQFDELGESCRNSDSVELIDDGPDSAPSKRIGHVAPAYLKNKVTLGPLIAQRIGLERMRASCRHFRQWLESLELLGSAS